MEAIRNKGKHAAISQSQISCHDSLPFVSPFCALSKARTLLRTNVGYYI